MSMIHVNRNRQNLGLFSPEEIAEGLRSNRFYATDLAWREGMDGWQPLSTFTDLPAPAAQTEPELSALPIPAQNLEPFPWENREKLGIWKAFGASISQTLSHPGEGFRRVSEKAGLLPPYIFYLIVALPVLVLLSIENVAVINFFITAFPKFVASNPELSSDPQFMKQMDILNKSVGTGQIAIWDAFVVLVIGPSLPLIWSGIYHLMLMLFGGARESFIKTFAVTCYVFGATLPMCLVPCCGQFITAIWGMVALSIGFAAVHRTDSWRSTLAVLVPVVFCCGSYLALSLVGSMAGLGTH